jgi:hypothetical protein
MISGDKMEHRDADLFLDWAASEFLAAGRAGESDRRYAHRRQAELFCDIFHALNQSPAVPPKRKQNALIGKVLERAFPPATDPSRG